MVVASVLLNIPSACVDIYLTVKQSTAGRSNDRSPAAIKTVGLIEVAWLVAKTAAVADDSVLCETSMSVSHELFLN